MAIHGGNTDAHINWLEYLASFMGLAMAATIEKETPTPWSPTLLSMGDNTTSNKVTDKGTARTNNHVASALCRLACTLERESVIATRSGKVSTHDNKFADDLSRGPIIDRRHEIKNMTTNELRFYLFQTDSTMEFQTSYRKWIPSLELLSLVSTAILNPRDLTVCQTEIRKLSGRLSAACIIFMLS